MVKVFLEESAELCIERLNVLIKSENDYIIVCPNDAFIKKWIAFFPDLADKKIKTFSQLISELGYSPTPPEMARIPHSANPFCDPSIQWLNYTKTLSAEDQAQVSAWLNNSEFWNFENPASQTSVNFCKSCVFFGPFSPALLSELQRYLKPFFENFFTIRRTFKAERTFTLTQTQGYCVRNIQEEREYIRSIYNKNIDFIASHPENWIELFQTNSEVFRLRWVDYQEENTLGYFLPYWYTSAENKTVQCDAIKKLQNAQKHCYREDLSLLNRWLSLQEETSFAPIDWPDEDALGKFVQRLNACPIAWNFPKILESCPIKFTRRQFFAYLRRNAKHYVFGRLIPWENALYFPIKEGCFLHGVSEDPTADNQRLSWLNSIEDRGGALTVIIPERDEKGMPYKPLIPAIAKPKEPAQKIDPYDHSNPFTLPKERLKLSCKNWERFRLSPIKTWLDAILKVKKFDLIQPNIKARICGEWVHENLEFETQPKDLNTWQDSISQKAECRWRDLKALFGEKMPIQLQQWHTKTYRLSLGIAQACSDLLEGSWNLQSEYTLPKNAFYSGRIDLLATRLNEAVIVDFKTATDYTLTPKRINKGYGLQLLLYGKALEPYYENIQLRVINGDCANLTLDLHEISSEIQDIEAWIEAIKRTGIYTYIPEEKRDTLPFCWR